MACDFDINFVLIVPRQEGSAHNGRVFAFAKDSGFYIPPGRYYLADASYAADDPIVLILYQKVRYYLKEQVKISKRPKNKKELFNLYYASLRNVIKRAFSVLKARFPILNKGRKGYSLKTQVKIIQVLTAIYNFININGWDLNKEDSGYISEEDLDTDKFIILYRIDKQRISQQREDIVEVMQKQYLEILDIRGVNIQ